MGKALVVNIVGDASSLKRAFDTSGSAASKFGGLMKKAGLAIAASAVAGTVASVKAFANFDAAMTQSTAIMGDLSDKMRGEMSTAAREVGKTTKFSATQAAESYFFLASAGLNAKQSINALPVVARFAQAGMFDMAQATDLATDAQSALGLSSDNAKRNLDGLTRVTDVLVKANILANASVEQFSEALTEKAGAALRSLNVDMETGVATLAVFADQGVKGSKAGTALNATLIGLTENSRKNAAEFKELGVQVFDAEGNMRNIADIVGQLETGMAGMSVEQQRATLAGLGFNQQALDGILALLGNSEALREYEGELRNAGGTAEEVANKQLKTFWEQLGLLKAQFIDIGLSIGEALMPALETFVGWVQEQMPAVEGIFSGTFKALQALFGSTTVTIDKSTSGWEANFNKTGQHLVGWEKTTGDVFEDHRSAMQKVSDFIEDDLVPAFRGIRAWWDRNWPKIKAVIDAFGQVARFVFGAIRDFIEDVLVPAFASIRAWWDRNFTPIKTKVDGLNTAFGEMALGVKGNIEEQLNPAFEELRKEWDDDSSDMRKSAVELDKQWEETSGNIQGLMGDVGKTIGTVTGGIIKAFGGTTESAERDWSFLADAVTVGQQVIILALKQVNAAVTLLRRGWKTAVTDVITQAGEMKDGIVQKSGEAVEWMRGLPDKLRAALGDTGMALFSAGRDLVAGFISGIVSKIGEAITAARDMVGNVVGAVTGALDSHSPSRVFIRIGGYITQGLAMGIDKGTSVVVRSMDNMTKKMRERVVGEVQNILSAINAAAGVFDARGNLKGARQDLRRLNRQDERLPDNIADAEKAVAAARTRAQQVTLEEELAIIQAREDENAKLAEMRRLRDDSTASLAEQRIAEIEATFATRRRIEAVESATAKTDEVREAEEHLADLRKRAKSITSEQRDAEVALISAQASAIASQLQLASAVDELGKASRPARIALGQLAAAADITGPSMQRLIATMSTPLPTTRAGKSDADRIIAAMKEQRPIIVNDRSGDPVETARRTSLALRMS